MKRPHDATYIHPGEFVPGLRLQLTAMVLVLLVAVGIGMATSAATAQAAGRFGVVLHPAADLPDGGLAARAARGNVASMRIQFYWPLIQRDRSHCSPESPSLLSPSGCDWAVTDQAVARAAKQGIEVLPFFYGTPPWLRPSGAGDGSSPVASREARAKWRGFVKAAAQRYGPNGVFWDTYPGPTVPIRTWQIWNEQGSATKWGPRASPREYSTLLNLAHAAITEVDRDARLMLGGLFGTPPSKESLSAWRFLSRLYDIEGIKAKFDQVAIHPYSGNLYGIKYQMNKVRRVMDANRDRRTKLAVTEIGWGSGRPSGGELHKGLKGQKRMLQRSFRLFNNRRRSWKLGTIYWFSLVDVRDCSFACNHFDSESGLFRGDGDPKPVWRAFTRFTGGRP